MAEGADEVGVVGKAGHLARLLDADALLQQLPGVEDPAVDDVLHDGKAGGRLEDAAQVVLADVELAGDLVQGEGLGEVVADVVQNGGHPKEVLVAHSLARGGRSEHRGHPQQQVEQGHRLADVAAEAAVVFVALQGLEELDDGDHLLVAHGGPKKTIPGQAGEVGLGGGQQG